MCKTGQLNYERLEFIIENCTKYLNISSILIKTFIKNNNNNELLGLLFKKNFKFFDNKFILNLLLYYKNKTRLSDNDLYPQINDKKYKLSLSENKYVKVKFDRVDSAYFLFNACKSGNKNVVKFLLNHGADLSVKDNNNETTISFASVSENEHLVKYLVKHGANINTKDKNGRVLLFYDVLVEI